jgi:hypothetical protein
MSRKNFLQTNKLTIPQLVEMYYKSNCNCNALAKRFSTSSRTIRRWLNHAGLTLTPGCSAGYYRRTYSALVHWCANHPGVVLPRSWKAIRKLTGLSKNIVNSFFIHRRKIFMKNIGQIEIPKYVHMKTTCGKMLPFAIVELYQIKGDYLSDQIEITAYVGPNKFKILTTLEDLKEITE